jgi:hypothetical protein
MGSRPAPQQPIRAHAGLVSPKKRLGYDWMPIAERAHSINEIDEWCTVLLIQDFGLRVRWV